MMNSSPPPPIVSDLVLIGGGHSHVHVLKMLGMPQYRALLQRNGIRVTLISNVVHTPYSGMLPGFVSGHYTYDEIHLDLRKLCRFSNIQLIVAGATKIDYYNNNFDDDNDEHGHGQQQQQGGGGGLIYCDDGRPPIRYDCLSIDIGSSPGASDQLLLKSGSEHVIGVKPIANFCKYYEKLKQNSIINTTMSMETNNSNEDQLNPSKPSSETSKLSDETSTASDSSESSSSYYRVCVVGGGAGGIELALSIQYNLRQLLMKREGSSSKKKKKKKLRVVLVTRGNGLLKEHNSKVQKIFQRVLNQRGVEIHYNCEVIGVVDSSNNDHDETNDSSNTSKQQQQSKLILKDTTKTILFDDCFVCTTAAGASWLKDKTPFDCDSLGFLKVNSNYEVTKGVFAAGDCCSMIDNPRPKAGVFAVRAGPPLLDNIIRYLTNQPLKPHQPQTNFLSLISTGDKYAVASKGNYLCIESKMMWTLKDYIDRAFMDKFTLLPDMNDMTMKQQPQQSNTSSSRNGIVWWKKWFGGGGRKDDTSFNNLPPTLQQKSVTTQQAFLADPMRCGGCGAKVGSTSLSRVLRQLHKRQIQRAKQFDLPEPSPIDHDDAAISPITTTTTTTNGDGGSNGAMIHTIDYFRALIEDPYIFGKIVAVHALSDVHAMGAMAQTALSLAVIPFAADDAIVESTLLQLLAGMSDVLQDEHVKIIGGHTCEGLELACGLAIQGYTPDPQRLLRKRGGHVGDVIVLTKPIGTGALFALDMRAKLKGEYLLEAIQFMQKSNGPASRVAANQLYGVQSCTDVTGFGLLGHLLEMLMANDDDDNLDGIGAKIRIEDVPFLRGGIAASELGVYSSLQPQNARTRRAVKNHAEAAKISPIKYPLLFDPCTAGGLMMFVDPDKSVEFLAALEAEGVHANVIGELVAATKQKPSAVEGEDDIAVCTMSGTAGRRIEIEL